MSYLPPPRYQLLGKLLGANMNSTADQPITLASANCRVDRIVVTNPSLSLTLAAGGFYTAAAKGGTVIVAAAQVYSALTAALLCLLAAIAVQTRITGGTLYFSLTVAQGAPATADIYIWGENLDAGQA